MRLWHQLLLPHLDRQRLLGQHRECAALRGKGWGRKHATVDYAFTHRPECLVAYHKLVMDERKYRGYKPDEKWYNPAYRGSAIGLDYAFADADMTDDQYVYATKKGGIIYPEHNDAYLHECVDLLHEKMAPIEWEKVEDEFGFC